MRTNVRNERARMGAALRSKMLTVDGIMRGMLRGLSGLFGSLGISCVVWSFWAPTLGGDAFVMLATASGIVAALDWDRRPGQRRPQ